MRWLIRVEPGGTKILVIVTIFIILLSISFSGCFEDGDKDENNDSNIIATGRIYGEDIYENTIIWTEEKEDGRYLYYYDIENENLINFIGPISSGYTSGIYNKKIVWVEIKGNFADIHLYDIEKKQDKILKNNVGRTAVSLSPKITKDYIIWISEISDMDNEISTLFRYHFSNETIDEPIKNISNWRDMDIDGNTIVIIHDFYYNCTIYDMATGIEYTLEKHHVTSISLSDDKLIFQETINDPPGGGLHVGCEGSWDEIFYLYDLKTQEYKQITERETNRAGPDMDNNYIVWQGDHTFESGLGGEVEQDWDIFLYNVSTGTEKRLTKTEDGEYGPIINGNSIIWSQCEKGSLESKLIFYIFD
jgi:hypothetical protein